MSQHARALARFVAFGPIGTALGALQYECLWRLNPAPTCQRAWTTWCVSAAMSIAWIHAVHCRFTFARPLGESYLPTLARAYALQGTSTLLGAGAIVALEGTSLHHLLSWLLVTVATSLMNFAGLVRMLGRTP